MTFLAQVRHVVAKDLREARWFLAAYAALVVGVTVHAAGWFSGTGIAGGLWSLLVMPVGMFAAASVVQADPPLRSTAFWMSRPLASSAVLAAKLVVALAIVSLGVAGQVLALAAYDVPMREILGSVGGSALMFMTWMLAASVFAAVAADLRTFTLLLLAALVLAVVASAIERIDVAPALAAGIGRLWTVMAVGVATTILAWAYRRRDIALPLRVVVAALVALLIFVGPPIAAAGAEGVKRAPAADHVGGRLQLLPIDRRHLATGVSHAMLQVDPRPGYSMRLGNARMTFHLHGGASMTIGLDDAMALTQFGVPDIAGVQWLADVGSGPWSYGLEIPMTAEQRALVVRSADSVTLEGRVTTTVASVAAVVPLRPGNASASRGRRFFIDGVTREGDQVTLDLMSAAVVRPEPVRRARSTASYDPFATRYALLNRSRGEAIALTRMSGHGSGGGLVLPGPTLEVHHYQVSTAPRMPRASASVIDDRWLADAELVAIDWISRGAHQVRLTAVVGAR